MSDDDAGPELLELLRQSLGISSVREDGVSSNTGVLVDAEHVYNNSIDVAIDMYGTKAAAGSIYKAMQERGYSTQAWSEHVLHPKQIEGFSEIHVVNFIFTMDLLNFSFWSGLSETDRFQVEYRGRRWTGYNSLLACLRRGLDEGVPITSPRYWRSHEATDEILRTVFRSATNEPMPLLDQRIAILREAAEILHENFEEGVDTAHQGATKDDDQQVAVLLKTDSSATGERHHESSVKDAANDAAVSSMNIPDAVMADSLNDTHDGEILGGIARPADLEGPGATQLGEVPEHQSALETHTHLASESESEHVSQEQAHLSPIKTKPSPPPDSSIVRLIEQADHSAGKLVNLLAQHFPCFRDETRFDGRKVHFLKRAQIFVADLWAAFNGTGYGAFDNIECLTMFADYRVPQMLHTLGVLSYSPPLLYRLRDQKEIPSGHSWEVQLRGCSIWAVELIRREIVRQHPEAEGVVNAVLIDFFLYDLAKERERGVGGGLEVPHHRTRSIWY
ncbi:hypothetical protein LTR57_018277 [Friedmanniomyces endolithicus]|uniref:Queuosine 5'-phosphate N-glycosylase/hydrolase n=2 Tax=Dothideomycetidae TaxID=451867 RepID=A0A4U0USK7_9PEZI|nr:hypothetical protein LTS09_005608 [Friedmanniomyces endolithicus]KAK0804454.1 hypothetical protein LTR38_005867 [Friedmanniomyces endolithicus]KAK0841502.1 hypothetical protein LTR03_009903 [Friedmanniomyces endolithicus]KAK0905445.1 hypothetical protein LTR57_018277 [Friedmanniomyces endolithicus]KAK0983035.1 hypothetical protein LTS01_011174 [Friedmanniomyces endolithicus]